MARNYWLDFMGETFGCYANEVTGNMPCDNGMVCDRCNQDWVDEAFKAWKEDEIAREQHEAQKDLNLSDDKVNQLVFMKKMLLLMVGDIKTEVQFIGAFADTLLLVEELLREYDPMKFVDPAEILTSVEWLFNESADDDEDYDPCDGCGGEDCACCDVWLERQADHRYENDTDY